MVSGPVDDDTRRQIRNLSNALGQREWLMKEIESIGAAYGDRRAQRQADEIERAIYAEAARLMPEHPTCCGESWHDGMTDAIAVLHKVTRRGGSEVGQ